MLTPGLLGPRRLLRHPPPTPHDVTCTIPESGAHRSPLRTLLGTVRSSLLGLFAMGGCGAQVGRRFLPTSHGALLLLVGPPQHYRWLMRCALLEPRGWTTAHTPAMNPRWLPALPLFIPLGRDGQDSLCGLHPACRAGGCGLRLPCHSPTPRPNKTEGWGVRTKPLPLPGVRGGWREPPAF